MASSVKEVQAAFDKKHYQEALDLIEQITKEKEAQPDIRRLKIRSLIFWASRRMPWQTMTG